MNRLARQTLDILEFCEADHHEQRDRLRMELSAQAQWHYAQLYRGELNDDLGSELVSSLLERRAPMLLRLAMLFALTDLQTRIEVPHIEAAMSWMRYATASVTYVFVSADEEAKLAKVIEFANRVLEFLRERGYATRSEISTECFRGRVTKVQLDVSLDYLLTATPARICVQWVKRLEEAAGSPTSIYRLA